MMEMPVFPALRARKASNIYKKLTMAYFQADWKPYARARQEMCTTAHRTSHTKSGYLIPPWRVAPGFATDGNRQSAFTSRYGMHLSGEANMNNSKHNFKPRIWLMTLLLAVSVAGCGGGGGGANAPAPTSPGAGTGLGGAGHGPTPVVLGGAGNFVILAETLISTTGTTAVTGDLAISPAAASYITGFSLVAPPTTSSTSPLVTGLVFASDYNAPTPSNLTTAVNNMMTAYTDAAGRAPDFTEEIGRASCRERV